MERNSWNRRPGLYPLPPAAIPGVEAVGVVVAVGGNVTSLQVGDRIAYGGAPVGAYASERFLPAWRAVGLPPALADETVASAFVKGMTAHMLLTRIYPVTLGTRVLIHSAAGGLGQLLTRWARHLGAMVIGTVGSDPKASIAREAGADRVVVGRDTDFISAVADLTGGSGVDVAFDGAGGETLQRTFACVRPFGVVASIGQSADFIPAINVEDLGPRRSLMLARPSVVAYMNDARNYAAAAEAVLSALEDGTLPASGRAYRLTEASRAHSELEAGRTWLALLGAMT